MTNTNCANCHISFVSTVAVREILYQSLNPSTQSKWIKLKDAITSIYNIPLLQSNLEIGDEENFDILMCGPCATMLTTLYRNHLEFTQNTHINSFLSNKFKAMTQTPEQPTTPATTPIELGHLGDHQSIQHFENLMELDDPDPNILCIDLDLDQHSTPTSDEGRIYSCILCETPCHNAAAYSRHLLWHHVPRDSTQCPIIGCQKILSNNTYMKYHIDIHVGNRPYKCEYAGCSKAYPHPTYRRQHYQISHADQKFQIPLPPTPSSSNKNDRMTRSGAKKTSQSQIWYQNPDLTSTDVLEIFKDLPFIPWGSKTLDEYELINTCALDNTLMVLTAMTHWCPDVLTFLIEESSHLILADTLLNVTKLVQMGQFNHAKFVWIKDITMRRVMRRPSIYDCHGSEDEISFMPLTPLFRKYTETHVCPTHHQIYNRLESICHFESGTVSSMLSRLKASCPDKDLRCRIEGCGQLITRKLAPPSQALPFLIFNVHEEHDVRNIPAQINILGTDYMLFCASLKQHGKDHFVSVYPCQNDWALYDGLYDKGVFQKGLPTYDSVSLVWYLKM